MTDEQIQKLPKWAQAEFVKLQRERDAAVAKMKQILDDQTPSGIYTDDMISIDDGESRTQFIKRYFQSRSITIDHHEVRLRVLMSTRDGSYMGGIDLQWGPIDGSMRPVAFIPKSYQQAELVAKENMR